MKKYLLKYSFIIVLLGVELYARHFLIKNDLYDPNSFFINWGLVWLFLLSLSLLGNGASKSLRVGGCIRYRHYSSGHCARFFLRKYR